MRIKSSTNFNWYVAPYHQNLSHIDGFSYTSIITVLLKFIISIIITITAKILLHRTVYALILLEAHNTSVVHDSYIIFKCD